MAKSSTAAVKQAKKKHEKALRRKETRFARTNGSRGVHNSWSAQRAHKVDRNDRGIERYAGRFKLPYFRAAFEVSYPPDECVDTKRYPWNLTTLDVCEEIDLAEGMGRLGIVIDRGAFRESALQYRSAMDLAREVWLPRLPSSSSPVDRDFVFLATHELWKLWCMELPSREMAAEALLHLRRFNTDDNSLAAIGAGLRFWKFVKPHLDSDLRSLDELDARLDIGDDISSMNELLEFRYAAMELVQEEPELARRAACMLEEMGQWFTAEQPKWHIELTEDRARILYETDQRERAEVLMQDAIAKHPERARGYMVLADLWASTDERGKRRAIELLERAEALPVIDGVEEDLSQHIEWLYEELGDAFAGAAGRYGDMSTQRLVRLLQFVDDDDADKIVRELGSRGDDAVTLLERVVGVDRYCPHDGCLERISLRRAFRALGEIGSIAAANVLIKTVNAHDQDPDLPWEACAALEMVTPDAVPLMLEAAVKSETASIQYLASTAAAYEIAVKHPEWRHAVTEFVKRILSSDHRDKRIHSYAVLVAARIDDPDVCALLEARKADFDRIPQEVWQGILERRPHESWKSLRYVHGSPNDGVSASLNYSDIRRGWDMAPLNSPEPLDNPHNSPAPAPASAPKLGRNELCYCGSGKKYKKCCLQ